LQQEEEKNKKSENSCFDSDFEDDKEESILFSSLIRSAISRPFITQNQLHAKYIRESKVTKQEKVRTKLFCLY
jgi:hypothetical protein